MTVSAEGANQVVSGSAVDKAGNTATASVTLNIDKTAPIVTATQSPVANNGWNNTPVTIAFAATDELSGVASNSLSTPVTLSTDGRNLSVSGQATDLAGNVGVAKLSGINVDQSKPTITASLTLSASANGWNSRPVTARFTTHAGHDEAWHDRSSHGAPRRSLRRPVRNDRCARDRVAGA